MLCKPFMGKEWYKRIAACPIKHRNRNRTIVVIPSPAAFLGDGGCAMFASRIVLREGICCCLSDALRPAEVPTGDDTRFALGVLEFGPKRGDPPRTLQKMKARSRS